MTTVFERLRDHPAAPTWNHRVHDRLTVPDLAALEQYRRRLPTRRRSATKPPPSVLTRVARWRQTVPLFRRTLGSAPLDDGWSTLSTMSREELARAPEELIPDDADLPRMVCYRTSGTTGHVLLVPYHPLAAASNCVLIEEALRRHGVALAVDDTTVACFLVGAQSRTVTYPAFLQAWRGAGFAKLNLRAGEWPNDDAAARYFTDLSPQLLTGDPISLAELLRLGLPTRPRAILTTAVAMSAGLSRRLATAFACPVIDWYSLTETGPIGYACAHGQGFHLLPDDIYLEILDPAGRPVPDGDRGEVTVSGGRNPFIPLCRYRTGDFGRLDRALCSCGDAMPLIRDLEGRPPVDFRASDGSAVNPVDISRVLRELPLVQHELTQRADRSLDLVARPIAGAAVSESVLTETLAPLFGTVVIRARLDETLGDRTPGGKAVPYRSELLYEE